MTLEEVDIKFDGEKHSDMPDLKDLKGDKLDVVLDGAPLDRQVSETVMIKK